MIVNDLLFFRSAVRTVSQFIYFLGVDSKTLIHVTVEMSNKIPLMLN